jgi:excisionase family DNA binding protein
MHFTIHPRAIESTWIDPDGKEMDKQLYKPEEAAETLAVSRSRIYELIGLGPNQGGIRSILIGGSRRIKKEAIEEFLASLEDAPSKSERGGA